MCIDTPYTPAFDSSVRRTSDEWVEEGRRERADVKIPKDEPTNEGECYPFRADRHRTQRRRVRRSWRIENKTTFKRKPRFSKRSRKRKDRKIHPIRGR